MAGMTALEIGIFAKVFVRPTFAQVLDAVAAHGIHHVQFNLACAGLPTLPEAIPDELCDAIRAALAARDMHMAALSGTFNMIHPDVSQRREGLRRLRVLAAACARLGTPMVTLCTGTRDPDNMWQSHPANASAEAWADLLESMRAAVRIAEDTGIVLGVEPELSNVIDSATKARRLLDELGSPHVKIVMDGSNLLHPADVSRMGDIFAQAFDLLGHDIALVHAKDLIPGGHGAAGTGLLDYATYLRLLRQVGYSGPLILHTLSEDQVDASVAFLRRKGISDF